MDFKIVETNNKSINRSIRLRKDMLQQLNLISKVAGVSVNKIIVKCIEFSLKNMKK